MDAGSSKEEELEANWSRDDSLNHVADKIATGEVDFDIDGQYELIELQTEDIMNSLIIPHRWRLQIKDRATHTGRTTASN